MSELRTNFASGKTKTIEWKRNQLKQFIKMLEENQEAFATALNKDLRKPKQEAVAFEVMSCQLE